MSSWSNVQVYWSPVENCSCDWSVANKEEKRGLLSLPAAEHTTFTQPNTDTDTHHNFWSSAALIVFAMYKQY